MEKYSIEITEQKPVNNSIFCEMKIFHKIKDIKSEVNFGHQYFVCDLNKNIIQAFEWMINEQSILKQIRELGYKWNNK